MFLYIIRQQAHIIRSKKEKPIIITMWAVWRGLVPEGVSAKKIGLKQSEVVPAVKLSYMGKALKANYAEKYRFALLATRMLYL